MTENTQEQLHERLDKVKERVKHASSAAGRDPEEIEVVVVTKNKSAAVIKQLVELGIGSIGESYLKEALFKQSLLKDYDIEWHMIGVLQKSKVKDTIGKFKQIHSVDSISLAGEIQKRALKQNLSVPVYLEMNLSNEDSKHGWKYSTEEDQEQFLAEFKNIQRYDALNVIGLMTMAPYSVDPENSRSYFRKLRQIRDTLITQFDNIEELGLSMGMSGDFEVAIEEGATILRIGSAIVGER
jgi:pyridoxal phosphate enzyme (YggS family)